METIEFFKSLKEGDWDKKISEKRTVKDVLGHLVGWEREVANELNSVFEKGNEPWFMLTDKYDEFNEKIYREFKNYSPKDLIKELEKWEGVLNEEIIKFGEEKIRQKGNLEWVFDEGKEPHFEHHIRQIEKALKLK